jgi:hypothetical protein
MPRRPGGAKAKGKGAASAVPSPEDDLQAEATRGAALTIAKVFEESYLKHNADRLIRSLRIEDLDRIACAAISGWLTERAKQAHRLGKPDQLTEMIRDVPVLP